MSVDVENITSKESAQIKLKELSEEYKQLADELLKKSYQVAIVREQINYCMELIAAFNDQDNKKVSDEE